jgi:hypothetical protein
VTRAVQAEHDEFKRFVWPAIQHSTIQSVCMVLGASAAAWMDATVGFEDIGSSSPPAIARCGSLWLYAGKLYEYAPCLFARVFVCTVSFFFFADVCSKLWQRSGDTV